MKAKLSLIICSKNRATRLKMCLASISSEEMLEVKGELILVNNGSTDNTEEVMCKFKEDSSFPVKIVNEPTPGLGNARNAGISKSEGDILVFTDDDCYLERDYLIKASRIFESDEFQYCGGRVMLYDNTDVMLSTNYLDKKMIIPSPSIFRPAQILGCNMIFHRRVIDKIGLFDPMFGAGTRFPCEDLDYLTRASLAGFTGAYIPELIVYHHHGLKCGVDMENRLKSYAYGAGAYYMKFLLMGKIMVLKQWIPLINFPSKKFVKADLRLPIKKRLYLFIIEIWTAICYLSIRLGRMIRV